MDDTRSQTMVEACTPEEMSLEQVNINSLFPRLNTIQLVPVGRSFYFWLYRELELSLMNKFIRLQDLNFEMLFPNLFVQLSLLRQLGLS